MSVLVLAERDGAQLKPSTYQAMTAAAVWELPIDLLVYGDEVEVAAAEAKQLAGVRRVLTAEAGHFQYPLVEDVQELVLSIASQYTHILSAHSVFGKSVVPGIAARLDIAPITDVIEIQAPSTYVRPAYAGNILTTIENHEPVQIITVRATAFRATVSRTNDQGDDAELISIDVPPAREISQWISEQLTHSERPELNSARVVIAGGRSLGEDFNALLDPIAVQLDAAIGATRACVDAGFAANDLQVGQTGTIIAPELYIAVGISGAMQHLAGIKDSKIIVAINHDPDAPIFKHADYGLVGDLFTVLPELNAALQLNAELQQP
ncbi:MAG: FAD-binding protein [Cellvibrio sp.]|uniref:FAD-binding protein n=1 Tax=Cellvibrio sp. TaxID=1965322 RepID=UPI002717957F|nr:FAD-binding protein [Cellvibrio sp.]